MTEKLNVGLHDRSYPIWIGNGILEHLPARLRETKFPDKISIISNTTVFELYGEQLLQDLRKNGFEVSQVVIEDGEQYKTLATLSSIYDALLAESLDRGSGIVALGGGVVGDIAGFAAATFLRGIPFIQVPTTLLAQVDSSVGGKTAVNHAKGKNLIGAFYQPRLVFADVDVLDTLGERDYLAGLAEVIKYGVIRDIVFFDWIESQLPKLLKKDRKSLIHAVKTSCQIKANIVEIDETESSLRAILNYGHTFGHAVEALTGYSRYLHGEAVAIGMVFAARFSTELGYCSVADADRIESLLVSAGLPVAAPDFPVSDYMEAMGHDKKVQAGDLRMILNRGIGECEIVSVEPREFLGKYLDKQMET